ncbi:MAG: helix-turn-helix transcriptional regulator [Synechococcus sp.]|uniref:helix-turn-helix domain-containing protein n=1 Tax=Synechococcus sp. BMK-MC-1 TaxID=1442551 RepID=UPI0016476648|nr:helix-turn-helix domain-containing protein [Synechococcus sp. BMK-MC-1]QNI68083.1 transcriptional regulator/ AraC family [Synechococcus sp. BMK-MC-1]
MRSKDYRQEHLEKVIRLSLDQPYRWSAPFKSATELASHLKRLGKTFEAIQLSQGRLSGRFSYANFDSITILEISSNQCLLLNGDRGPDCMSFCLESSGVADEHKTHTLPVPKYSINGFKSNLRESHFQLTANTTTYFAITSAFKINTILDQHNAEALKEQFLNCNSAQITPSKHKKLKILLQEAISDSTTHHFTRQQTGNTIIKHFLDFFASTKEIECHPFELTQRQLLVKDLIQLGFNRGSEKLNLDSISKQLYCSKRTLIQGTKDAFEMGPMELMKIIRLEQVNWMLRSEEARSKATLRNVTDIAQHFNFHSRGHFARAYQNLFEESPSQTLQENGT